MAFATCSQQRNCLHIFLFYNRVWGSPFSSRFEVRCGPMTCFSIMSRTNVCHFLAETLRKMIYCIIFPCFGDYKNMYQDTASITLCPYVATMSRTRLLTWDGCVLGMTSRHVPCWVIKMTAHYLLPISQLWDCFRNHRLCKSLRLVCIASEIKT